MNREHNCKVSSKHSKRLLKNWQNTTGGYFLPHSVAGLDSRLSSSRPRPRPWQARQRY